MSGRDALIYLVVGPLAAFVGASSTGITEFGVGICVGVFMAGIAVMIDRTFLQSTGAP